MEGLALERRQTGPSPEPEEREKRGRRDLCEKAEGKKAVGAALRAGFLSQCGEEVCPGRRRPGEQGQSGLEEPSGKDSEQLSRQSDRELKMEQRKMAEGTECDGSHGPWVRLLCVLGISSTERRSLGSGREDETREKVTWGRERGTLENLAEMAHQATRESKGNKEGGRA